MQTIFIMVKCELGKAYAVADKAAQVCPVGVILKKRDGFAVPIGERTYDKAPISESAAETEGR